MGARRIAWRACIVAGAASLVAVGGAPAQPGNAGDAVAEVRAQLAALGPEAGAPEQLRPLILALTAAESVEGAAAEDLAAGWTAVLERLSGAQRWPDAHLAADRAIGLIASMEEAPAGLRIAAAEAGGRAALNVGAYDAAAWRFAWGAAAVAPLTADGAVDPLWADLTVRAAAARAAWMSLDEDNAAPLSPEISAPQDAAGCAPRWTRAPEARISRAATRRNVAAGGPGAALVAVDLGPDGVPGGGNVIATAPADRSVFREAATDAALEAAARWRADPDSLRGCAGTPYLLTFEFRVDPR